MQSHPPKLETTTKRSIFNGVIAMLPLTIAVIPWGILVGAYGMETGLSAFQTQMLSLSVFAGTSQLIAIGMLKSGASSFSIIATTLLITSRHLLYGLDMREKIKSLPFRWRVTLGFLLTDELFVSNRTGKRLFNHWYALGGGLSFYIGWNIATLVGIMTIGKIPDLTNIGLDFAIVATFVAILVPMIKNFSTIVCVIVSTVISILCALQEIQAGLLLSALSGMACGYTLDHIKGLK